MAVCSICGEVHEFLDPMFRRPEAYVHLESALRDEHAKSDDDLCWIALPDRAPRYFVRGMLPVSVKGRVDGLWWGLWAEVTEATFKRIRDLWTDPDQEKEPPFPGELANVIPSYVDTLGLRLHLHMTGPQSRPRFTFDTNVKHPFVEECQLGVDAHQASEWNELMETAP